MNLSESNTEENRTLINEFHIRVDFLLIQTYFETERFGLALDEIYGVKDLIK
jgi:hypothetical protein